MRAVAVTEFGGKPAVMELTPPVPPPGTLRVHVAAAGMNPYDWKILDGILKDRPHVFPLVAGVDGAGVVESVGRGVSRFQPGDRVFGQFLHVPVGWGTYAEYSLVPEDRALVRIPDSVTSTAASAIPTAGMTALDALERLGVGAGSSLLIVGASGGVGSFATQLASAIGAEVVALARPAADAHLRALGAREVLDITSADWPAQVRRAHGAGVDALLDVMSGREAFMSHLSLVRRGGRAATTVYAVDPNRPEPGVEAIAIDLQPSAPLLERVTQAVMRHGLTVPIARTISLDASVAALEEMRHGRSVGKTVVVL